MPRMFERNELGRMWDSLPLSPLAKKMIEIYSVSIVSSSLFTSLYYVGVLPQGYIWCVFCAAACVFVNFIWLAYRAKRSMDMGMEISDCRKLYLKVYLVHTIVLLFLSLFGDKTEPVYTFMFLPYKLFCFNVLPRIASAVIMSVVMLIANYYFPAVPIWLERFQKSPLKKSAVKMRKIKKIGGVKKKKTKTKTTRRTVRFSKKKR